MTRPDPEAKIVRIERRAFFIAALAFVWSFEALALVALLTNVLGTRTAEETIRLAYYTALWTGLAALATFMIGREW